MKTLITAALILSSAAALAHEIIGTPVLLGTAKGTAVVRGQAVECKVKIDDGLIGPPRGRRNLLQEDRFGNPAYLITAELKVEGEATRGGGRDRTRTPGFRHVSTVDFTNLHQEEGGSIVRDELYVGRRDPRARFTIDGQGLIKTADIPTNAGVVSCRF